MVVFSKSLVDVKLHKNRRFLGTSNKKIKFGDYAFLVKKESKMELVQLSFIKKMFKKLIEKKKKKSKNIKKYFQKNYKIWVNLLPNYVISRKSKNSRMGKGKGAFIRWVVRLKQNHILSEFKGISVYRLKKVLIKFNKKFNCQLFLVNNNKQNLGVSLWSKFNLSFEFFKKYRSM